MSSTAITLLVIAVLLVPVAGVFAAVDSALVGISRSGEGLIGALGKALDAARASGEPV